MSNPCVVLCLGSECAVGTRRVANRRVVGGECLGAACSITREDAQCIRVNRSCGLVGGLTLHSTHNLPKAVGNCTSGTENDALVVVDIGHHDRAAPRDHTGAERIHAVTLESALYLALFAAALVVRLSSLGQWPLLESEAGVALAVWRMLLGSDWHPDYYSPLVYDG